MRQSIHQMQRYVLGGVGLLSACAISFPIAMARVSATPKFAGQAVKSHSCAVQPLNPPQVIVWANDCRTLPTAPPSN
jgi:hypothetical protein